MTIKYAEKIKQLQAVLMAYLGSNDRHYGDLTRLEQSIEDLTQALFTRLSQLLPCVDECQETPPAENPRERLASRMLETAAKLSIGGRVDNDTVDQFEQSLDLLDLSADYKRKAETAKDAAETAVIKHKRDRV